MTNKPTYEELENQLAELKKQNEILKSSKDSDKITERKLVEEALKENEERYRQIYQFSPNSIIIHDLDMNILDANNKAIEDLGYSKAELLKKKMFELHPKSERPHSDQVLSAMKKKKTLTVETEFKRKDGSLFLAEATPCKYMLGSKPIVHVVIRDITKQKQAEDAVAKSNDLLTSVINKLPSPFTFLKATSITSR